MTKVTGKPWPEVKKELMKDWSWLQKLRYRLMK